MSDRPRPVHPAPGENCRRALQNAGFSPEEAAAICCHADPNAVCPAPRNPREGAFEQCKTALVNAGFSSEEATNMCCHIDPSVPCPPRRLPEDPR